MAGRGQRARRVGVFAVEDTSVQVCWADLAPGVVTVGAGCRSHVLDWRGGPGGVVVEGLTPGRRIEVTVSVDDVAVHSETVATLRAPGGEPVARLATLNDVHLGCSWFSVAGIMRERVPVGGEISATRCARAAVGDALAWGAERLVVKGDLVQDSTVDEWDDAVDVFGGLGVPIDVCLGNHEALSKPGAVPVTEGLARLGVQLEGPVRVRDLGGARLVVADTALHGRHDGSVAHIADELVEAAAVDVPVLVLLHHALEASRLTPPLPRGVRAGESRALLDALVAANPAVLVAAGHTHRHRLRRHGPVPVAEIGSSKDYPGVWCGYEITTAGVRQVVRRITGDGCMDWTERTGDALRGVWRRWSPGRLEDRCFVHRWPR